MNESLSYEECYALDISKYVEQKDSLSYLSWGHAIRLLKTRVDPNAYWTFEPPDFYADQTCMVRVSLYINGVRIEQTLFVMHRAQVKATSGKTYLGLTAKPNPSAQDISNAQQRCLVKAIACGTGIGLSLYTKESDEPVSLALSDELIDKEFANCVTYEALRITFDAMVKQYPHQKEAFVNAANLRNAQIGAPV